MGDIGQTTSDGPKEKRVSLGVEFYNNHSSEQRWSADMISLSYKWSCGSLCRLKTQALRFLRSTLQVVIAVAMPQLCAGDSIFFKESFVVSLRVYWTKSSKPSKW